VREQVTAGSIRVCFVCSQDQLADALTKPLSTLPIDEDIQDTSAPQHHKECNNTHMIT
jgi:hypothetical protein